MKFSCRSLPHGLDISLAKGSTVQHTLIYLFRPSSGPWYLLHRPPCVCVSRERASQPKRTRQRICVCSQLRMQDTTQCERPDTHPCSAWTAVPWIPARSYQIGDTFHLPTGRIRKSCYLPWRNVPYVDAAHTGQINRKISKLRICWHYVL